MSEALCCSHPSGDQTAVPCHGDGSGSLFGRTNTSCSSRWLVVPESPMPGEFMLGKRTGWTALFRFMNTGFCYAESPRGTPGEM